jgi:hypothetical protein
MCQVVRTVTDLKSFGSRLGTPEWLCVHRPVLCCAMKIQIKAPASNWKRASLVDIGTRLQTVRPRDCGLVPSIGKKFVPFPKHPIRLCCPLSHIFSVYGGAPSSFRINFDIEQNS